MHCFISHVLNYTLEPKRHYQFELFGNHSATIVTVLKPRNNKLLSKHSTKYYDHLVYCTNMEFFSLFSEQYCSNTTLSNPTSSSLLFKSCRFQQILTERCTPAQPRGLPLLAPESMQQKRKIYPKQILLLMKMATTNLFQSQIQQLL